MQLPELGVGTVYWPDLRPILERPDSLVDVLEVEPQGAFLPTSEATTSHRIDGRWLAALRDLPQPKIVHSVGAPVGGARAPDARHIDPLAAVIATLAAPWASEHLSFNRGVDESGPFEAGFLLPPCQTEAGATMAASTVRALADRIPVPLAVETGVNYLRQRPGELTDGEFVSRVVTTADCGILLDLHNVWTNALNGRQSVEAFLEAIPLDRVWEVHLAGGRWFDGYWLDAHSDLVPPELLGIARAVVPALPALRAIIFELLPSHVDRIGLPAIERQLTDLHEVWERRRPERMHRVSRQVEMTSSNDATGPPEWEDALAALIAGREPDGALGRVLADDPGVRVLRTLAGEARAGLLTTALPYTVRGLLLGLGGSAVRRLLAEFWKDHAPESFAATEALAFATFLGSRMPRVPHLAEILDFETAVIRIRLRGGNATVRFSSDPDAIFSALDTGRLYTGDPDEFVVCLESTAASG